MTETARGPAVAVPEGVSSSGFMPTVLGDTPQTWPPFLNGQPENPVRVILVDDDPVFTHLIERELPADLRIDLLGCAGTVRRARRLIDRQSLDVALIDLNLPDGTGFDVIEYLKAKRPMAEAVVVTASNDAEYAMQAFELGATGYLVKSCWFGNFAQMILQVVNGGAAITPSLARQLIKQLDGRHDDAVGAPASSSATHHKLSGREREILQFVSAGYTSHQISGRLMISEQTVNTHIRNVYRKLQVRTRAQAVSRATQWGLL